jgi:hypothetical protein
LIAGTDADVEEPSRVSVTCWTHTATHSLSCEPVQLGRRHDTAPLDREAAMVPMWTRPRGLAE